MNIYEHEKDIADLIQNNRTNSAISALLLNPEKDKLELLNTCSGSACSCDSIKAIAQKQKTADVMPLTAILVTDLWNANSDIFTAKEIIKARETPNYKPINWMHNGSEESENETIGVMVESSLVKGDLSNLSNFAEADMSATDESEEETISSSVHIKSHGLIWSQYFPTYAKKVEKGIASGKLYVSMECFFEDFDYGLMDEKTKEIKIIKRTESNSHLTRKLPQYGGAGYANINGKSMKIGRVLRDITFSGQGIVKDPANKNDNGILSIIINEPSLKVEAQTGNLPSIDPSVTVDPLSPDQQKNEPKELPKTYNEPKDYLYNTPEEAQNVAENELGCTGYHVYLEDRHSLTPPFYAKLIGDPSDIEKQFMRPKYMPCFDHKEFLLLSEQKASNIADEKEGTFSREGMQELGIPEGEPSMRNPGPSRGNIEDYISVQEYEELISSLKNSIYNNNKNECIKNKMEENKMNNEKTKEVETETLKELDQLRLENEESNVLIASATESIEKAIAEIEKLQAERKELSEENAKLTSFIAEIESTVSFFEHHIKGTARIDELNAIAGDLYSKEDFDTISKMSLEEFNVLKNSLSKVVSKIEQAVASEEFEDDFSEVEEDFKEEDAEEEFLESAISAVSRIKAEDSPSLLYKAKSDSDISIRTAKNLVSKVLGR